MKRHIRFLSIVTLLTIVQLTGCQPSDRTPGLWLRGENAEAFPSDWKFTDDYREIYIQVATPYLIPHSVTIWCTQVNGELFIGARNPESKNWPGWADKKPLVKLKVGNFLYDGQLQRVDDADEITDIKQAYTSKYQLKVTPGEAPPPMRYWRVTPP